MVCFPAGISVMEVIMIDFTGVSGIVPPQVPVLDTALRLSSYDAVAAATLAVIDSDPDTPDTTKHAMRAMAYRMATYNGGNPEAGTILHTIATTTWAAIGVAEDAVPALTTQQRAGIIDIVMGVSKSIIAAEAARLEALADTDTALPKDWDSAE